MTNYKIALPKLCDEVRVDICPHPDGGAETWMAKGKVLASWRRSEQGVLHVWGAIEVTRKLAPEENRGWQSDDRWNGCVFVCRFNEHLNDWRALWAASFRASELWGSSDEHSEEFADSRRTVSIRENPIDSKREKTTEMNTTPVTAHSTLNSGATVDAEKLIERCAEALKSLNNQFECAQGVVQGEQLMRLRQMYFGHHKAIRLALDHLKGDRRPQVGDPVCGVLVALRGNDYEEVVHFEGEVIGVDDRHRVHVSFNSFRYVDDEAEINAISVDDYLGVEITQYTDLVEWNANHREWRFELVENRAFFKAPLVASIPQESDDDTLHQTVVVGTEVRINITHVSLKYELLADMLEFVGVIVARWTDADGVLWAIAKIVRAAGSVGADQPREFLECLFLTRPCIAHDPRLFCAVRAADAKAEQVIAQMRCDVRHHFDTEEYLDWLNSRDRDPFLENSASSPKVRA